MYVCCKIYTDSDFLVCGKVLGYFCFPTQVNIGSTKTTAPLMDPAGSYKEPYGANNNQILFEYFDEKPDMSLT